ncbi:MAG: 50S ribosomal protein L24 [Candidatus Diapherotrites archaeon]|nr:50S ribosomal protein L24 [Candidatus Diapherotrites archaeon]
MKAVVSSKPKKQRRFHSAKPLHLQQHALAGHLSKQLRQQLGTRSIPVRKGDTVKVMRGNKKGTEGKVSAVSYRKGLVFIDKLVRKKVDGSEVPLPVSASNLLVVDLERSDAKRLKRIKGHKGQKAEKSAAGGGVE